jgi:hypothetical protein
VSTATIDNIDNFDPLIGFPFDSGPIDLALFWFTHLTAPGLRPFKVR